jgi:hypothetical protein
MKNFLLGGYGNNEQQKKTGFATPLDDRPDHIVHFFSL